MQESFEWVLRVLNSCENGFHLECAKKVVECFHGQYGEGPQYEQLLNEVNAKESLLMITV